MLLGRLVQPGVNLVEGRVGIGHSGVGCHCGALSLPLANSFWPAHQSHGYGGQQSVPIRCSNRDGSYLLRHAANVTDALEPHRVFGATAHSLDGVGRCSHVRKHVDMLLDAMPHPLQGGPEEVASRVGETEAEDNSFCLGVIDGSSLTRKIGQDNHTVGPWL